MGAPVGVDRDIPVGPADAASQGERSALTRLTEAEVLQLHEHHAGEVVIQLGHIDIVGSEAGRGVEIRSDGSEAGGREIVLGHLQPLLTLPPGTFPTLGRGPDQGWNVREVTSPTGGGRDAGRGTIGLLAVIQQTKGVGDQSR